MPVEGAHLESPQKPLRVTRELRCEEIRWDSLCEQLVSHFKLSPESAKAAVLTLRKRLLRPLDLYWYLNPALKKQDNLLLACLCMGLSSDILVLTSQKDLSIAGFELGYQQSLEFRPKLNVFHKEEAPGACRAQATLSFLGRQLRISSLAQLLLLDFVLSAVMILSYICVAGFLAYGTAVFVVFLSAPVEVTGAAIRHGHMGLALLCYLVVLAALFRRTLGTLVGRMFRRRKS